MLRIAQNILIPENIIRLKGGEPNRVAIIRGFYLDAIDCFLADYFFQKHDYHNDFNEYYVPLNKLIKDFEEEFETIANREFIEDRLLTLTLKNLFVIQHNKEYSMTLFPGYSFVYNQRRAEMQELGIEISEVFLPTDSPEEPVLLSFSKEVITLFTDYKLRNQDK